MNKPWIDAGRKVAAIGRDVTLETVQASQALYAAQHETEPYADATVLRDIAYGREERQVLDVFKPAEGDGKRPVLVFVHGGGFVAGNKWTPGTPYNDNVPLWALRNGFIGVNMTYRLAPAHAFPAGSEDVASAIAWVRANIAEHGGDPKRIFLMGTSAGATHVSNYIALTHPEDARRDLAGAILMSPIFEPATADQNEMLAAYYGDGSKYAERSALATILETDVPLMVTLAEHEPVGFERQAVLFIKGWLDRHGEWPRFVRLMGHNHLTSTMHLNAEDGPLGPEILRFAAETPSH